VKKKGILKLLSMSAGIAFLATGVSFAGNNCARPSLETQGDKDRAKLTASASPQGWLGVEKQINEKNHMVVLHVVPQSPADFAGFQVGDVIEWIDGITLKPESADQTFSAMSRLGETITYGIQRGNDHLILFAELVKAPDRERASLSKKTQNKHRAN